MVRITVEGKQDSAALGRRHSRRLASTRGLLRADAASLCGWVRVYSEDQSSRGTLVYLSPRTTVGDVRRDLVLGEDVTIWVQVGGGPSRRLGDQELPLAMQDGLLTALGYADGSRRARLGIDPELRHLLRFHVGPSVPLAELDGCARCGTVLVLKGLVFPQWRRRPVAVLGPRLFLYPGSGGQPPDVVDLSGGRLVPCPPRSGRLVLRIAPKGAEGTRHFFLGFNHAWERDLWALWLLQACSHTSSPRRLDLTDSGLERIPDSLSVFPALEDLQLGRNRLGGRRLASNNLELLAQLPRLRRLLLPSNELLQFPAPLLHLHTLLHLDLSDNCISRLPQHLASLSRLEELRLDRNELRELPQSVAQLSSLRTLTVGCNKLHEVPAFLLAMRALSLLDFQGNRVESGKLPAPCKDEDSPLGRINLRSNLLKGNIILGNYGNLTQLDVSENSIETLDLSALTKLESVQCSRNCLVELTLAGKALVSLIAGNNKLKKLTVNPPPANLKHLDVSYNELESLPEWTADCHRLVALFASHNRLRSLPEQLFCSELGCLQTLQLSYNKLARLPAVGRPLALHELFLQSNNLNTLPANFFTASVRLRVLNLSNNRLCELPADTQGAMSHQLEKVYLTANCLSDSAVQVLGALPNLRTLHAAYNCIATLPESCVGAWQDLEELVLSGNRLQQLPEIIVQLRHLRVLRVHSNRLDTIPCFARMSSLKVLDLAHNRLDRINLATLVPKQLQFLDLSCNSRLYVDPRQFQVYRSQRPMSLVDVSGQNRTSLPSTPYHEDGGDLEPPWKIGFSETPGLREKLYVTQIRLPAFCNTEGLFAMFDGGNNNEVPDVLVRAVPRILLEERTVKETASEYMKYTMLSAHRELKEKGQKYGVCGTLCHISRARPGPSAALTGAGFVPGGQRYVLRVASVGEARAVLQRRAGTVILTRLQDAVCTQNNLNRSQAGYSPVFPLVIPDPHITEVTLEENDEFLIIANKRFWEVVDTDEAVEEVREQPNPILAAKRLQDLAQSYGSEDNVSVLVVRFRDLGSEVEQLMRELRHTIRRSRQQQHAAADRCGLCHDESRHCAPRHACRDCAPVSVNVTAATPDTERSSPSGQSDRAPSDCGRYFHQRELVTANAQPALAHDDAPRKAFPSLERRSYRDSKRGAGGGVAKAIRARVEDEDGGGSGSERSGTQLSEEQFKCWEYMLEQNTQLLFDKELDTLTRGFNRRPALESPWPRGASHHHPPPPPPGFASKGRALSRSSPHLSEPSSAPPPALFLSKHFGSARSFTPAVRPGARYPASRHFLNGGPNAAYFGSLQRLMPYNLEYNFAVMHEKAATMDSLEPDGRMQQYWEVATTEL